MILSINFYFFYNIIKIFAKHSVRTRFAYFESKRLIDVEKKKSLCYGPNRFL